MNPIISEDMVSSYYKSMYKKKEKVVSYSKNRLMLGRDVQTGNIIYLPTKDAWRSIQIGPPGSGKTFLARAMCDRSMETGRLVVNLQDVKDEMKSSRLPVQPEFAKKLLDGEKPKGMKVVALRPTFFKQIEHAKLDKHNYWFSIALQDLQQSDLSTLFNVNKMTDPQKNAMQMLFEEIKPLGGIKSVSQLLEVLDTSDKIDTKIKSNLRLKLLPFLNSKLDIPQFQYDLVDMIKRGYNPIFNMQGYDNLSQNGSFDYPSMFVGIMLRKLINARRTGSIPPLLINFDEVLQIINTQSHNVAKELTWKSVIRDRQYNISFNFIVQDMNLFPKEFIKACRYFFIPNNLDKDDMKNILENVGGVLPAHHISKAKKLNHYLRIMKQHPYCWMFIDKNSPDGPVIFDPLPPLSHHMKTSN